MGRLLLLLLVAIASGSSVRAEITQNDLVAWAQNMPETIDGIRIYVPALQNNKVQISELLDFDNIAKERIFANVMLAIRQSMNPETDEIENVDYNALRTRLRRSYTDEALNAVYNYSVALQMDDGILSFLVYDISIAYRERGIIPLTKNIEKLNPAENRRHKELVESFVTDASRYVASLAEAVRSDRALPITHWADLRQGKVVKGMNPTEVMILKGLPDSERQSAQRTKWMYGNENVVVFTEGTETTVL